MELPSWANVSRIIRARYWNQLERLCSARFHIPVSSCSNAQRAELEDEVRKLFIEQDLEAAQKRGHTRLINYGHLWLYSKVHMGMGSFPKSIYTPEGMRLYSMIKNVITKRPTYRGGGKTSIYFKWKLQPLTDDQDPNAELRSGLEVITDWLTDQGLAYSIKESESQTKSDDGKAPKNQYITLTIKG